MAEALRKEIRAIVYTSDRSDAYGQHSWDEQPGLDAVVVHKRGATPSECFLTVRRDPADPGPLYLAKAGESETDRVTSGESGRILHPFSLRRHTFVKVQAQGYYDKRPVTVFLGRVWKYRIRGRGQAVTVCHDYRRDLMRIRCKGSRWRRPATADEVFIPDYGPHFNAEGRPDQMYDDSETAVDDAFITSGYNRNDSGQIDGAKDYAVFWSCGSALNCLRDLFNADPHADLDSTAAFLYWPAASGAGDWSYLFEDPVSGDARRVMDLDCSGRSLCWAIDQVIIAAGDADWYLSYRDDDRAELEVFSQYTLLAGEPEYLLEMGEPGGADPTFPDVIANDLEWDWTESYTKVRAVGARKVYDVTLDTTTSTLTPGWTSADETAWEALAEATDAQKKTKLVAYPDVFCAWVAPDDLAWTIFFGTGAKYREGPRRCFGELASFSVAEQEASDRPVRLRIIVWRSDDSGVTWERLPGQVQAIPLRDRVGFRLPPIVRRSTSYGGESAYVWSHNSGTAYDMRVTISVEADERLVDEAEDTADELSDWPAGELYLPAGPRYRYEARRWCTVPTSGGVPVLNSETFTELGGASDDVIQDDADELATLADRRLEQVARPMLRGSVTVKYIRTEYAPGGVLKSLNFGGDVGEIDIGQSIGEVTWDFRTGIQTTRLRLAGV